MGSFFVRALKAGGKFHGEPKVRDSESGYYSAAVLDFDGNSIEAVYRPSSSSAKSEVSVSPRGLLMEGSVVSKSSSKVSSVKPGSAYSPKSSARSPESQVSREDVAVDRTAPPVASQQTAQRASAPTYVVQPNQKTDDGKAAKTIVGTLIGAAAGAAIAYAISKGDSQSSDSIPPPQEGTQKYAQLPPPSHVSSSHAPPQALESQGYKFIEAPPARSTYSQMDQRPTLARSVTSKNPRASTIYEGTELADQPGYLDDHGRRASEGSVYSTRDLPLRAIEYQPEMYPCNPSTLISSFNDKPRQMSTGSIHSSSTIKPPKSNHQDNHSAYYSIPKSQAPSTASSTRTARKIPLPQGSTPSLSSYRSTSKSQLSARDIPLPGSVNGSSIIPEEPVRPNDSISQAGGDSRRSTHSHSHRSQHSKSGSRASKKSSKFDEPVRPSDSVSQVSSHASQRTVKAGGSVAGSKASSRRGSQAWWD